MIQINKKLEDRLRSEGYLKLKSKNPNIHQFRYLAPSDSSRKSIVCIENGSIYGVYFGQYWEEKYSLVDWNTFDCDCEMCKLDEAGEEMGITSRGFTSAIRNMENLDPDTTIEIQGLNLTKENNGWKKFSLFYKVIEE